MPAGVTSRSLSRTPIIACGRRRRRSAASGRSVTVALCAELASYANEMESVQRFLVPLLGRLGFGIVVNRHGQSEAGMDLIVGEIDRFAHVRYHGVQAKFEASIGKAPR